MYDIITIGSSLIDSFIKSDDFSMRSGVVNTTDETNLLGSEICMPYGKKIEVSEYLIRTGGGAGNTAVGFARMGFKTGIISEMGKDVLSQIILDDFRKEFVSTNLIISEKQEKTGGSIILVGKDGGRTVMVHRGASSMLDPEDIPTEIISRVNWIHLSSISGRLETLELIFKTLKKTGKLLSWNPGSQELKLILQGKLDLNNIPCEMMFVNSQEWESVKSKQQEILNNFKHVIITKGDQGGEVYLHGKVEVKFNSEQVESVDDTGAGDSFAVGFVAAHLKGQNLDEACRWGKENSLSVIQQVGAKPGLLTIDQIKVDVA